MNLNPAGVLNPFLHGYRPALAAAIIMVRHSPPAPVQPVISHASKPPSSSANDSPTFATRSFCGERLATWSYDPPACRVAGRYCVTDSPADGVEAGSFFSLRRLMFLLRQ